MSEAAGGREWSEFWPVTYFPTVKTGNKSHCKIIYVLGSGESFPSRR